jgi:hypothetical protein
MYTRKTIVAAAAAALVGLSLVNSGASGAILTNGNFESAPNADSATNTFSNWGESAPTGAVTPGNAAVKAVTALSGSTSALLTGTSNQVGTLSQTVDPISSSGTFDMSFNLAAVDPGGAGTGFRSFQLLLTGSNNGQINLIVTRGSTTSVGSVQLFSTSANAFQAIGPLADKINFSTSLSSPVVNTISISGTPGGNYTVTANGTPSGTVNFYQGSSNPTDFNSVNFTTVNAATVNYVVDNVTLAPEPASFGLMGLAAIGLLSRRRRA